MKSLLLIDDHDMLRTGVADWITNHSDWKIIGQASCMNQAEQLIQSINIDKNDICVAVVDLSLKESGTSDNTNGYSVLKMIKDSGKNIRTVVYSSFDSGIYINKAMSEEYGCLGYVSKNSNIHILLEAINEAALGNVYIQNDLSNTVKQAAFMIDALTKKEKSVIECMAQGLSNKEAAEKLGISQRTLENHLSKIYDKTDTNDKFSMLKKLGFAQ